MNNLPKICPVCGLDGRSVKTICWNWELFQMVTDGYFKK